MSTVNALLALVDTMYDNVVSTEDKLVYMNLALETLSNEFGLIVEDATLSTTALTDSYALPSGITDISQIVSLAIGNQVVPSSRYDYTQYTMSKSEDNPMSDLSFFQIINSSGTKKLCVYPTPSVTGHPIVIRYRKKLTVLSSANLGFEPEFNSKFHSLLAFYCAHMICTSGSSPDSYQADMFMKKYDDMLGELWEDTMEEDKRLQPRRRDNKQWHTSKSFSRGY